MGKYPFQILCKISGLFFIAALSLNISGCGHAGERGGYQKTEGVIWNTLYHITYKGDASLKDSILPVLNEVGHSLSVFDKTSLVSRLNTGGEVMADRHLLTVYEASKKINELSRGRFDPTVSPLVDAWGFGLGHVSTADTLAVDSILQFVGIGKTERKGEKIIKEDLRTRFNFSAIAKGYGCDAVGEMFRRNGVKDYMVEIGGELALSGVSPSGGLWKIAIDTPEEGSSPGQQAVKILDLTDCGVATSGNYRNFREEDGGKTVHTISPVTGRPVIGEILSATVIAPTCMEADALATTCMVGTVEQAKQLLREAGVKGYLITSDGREVEI